MKVKFWGVRGSVPSPIKGNTIKNKIKEILKLARPSDLLDEKSINHFIESLPFSLTHTYGGNTTCLEIRTERNELIIIDAGTGIRELGNLLLKEGYGEGKGECHMLFTHTHWDHIQGLPFFTPLYIKGNTFHIHAICENIEKRLQYQHDFEHFPIKFENLAATKKFYQHKEGEFFNIYNLTITTKGMKHPGGSYSYKIIENQKKLIFGSDAEFRLDDLENLEDYIEYFKDADILIFDTQYTFEEQLTKIDWGHSSAAVATDLALKANVKNLVLFHHDPSYSDETLDEVFMKSKRYKDMIDFENKKKLNIHIAYEGLELIL
ncbi:MAG: MBL fold metallo-hydrolase [Leptonema sp. (in: bacteria)]